MAGPSIIGFIILVASVCLTECQHSCYGVQLLRSGGLSCYDKHLIVDMHNKYRQKVALGQVYGQAPATNMLEMTWDDELARRAQDWANTCKFQHDSQSQRRVGRFYVGQNLATTWTSPRPNEFGNNPDFATQITKWFEEVFKYRGSFSHETGHYTQLIWGDSYLVGCGYSYYFRGSTYTKLYVCNYGPAGNVAGNAPYRKGSPSCSLYGTSPSKGYYGLCEVHGIFTNPCYYGY